MGAHIISKVFLRIKLDTVFTLLVKACTSRGMLIYSSILLFSTRSRQGCVDLLPHRARPLTLLTPPPHILIARSPWDHHGPWNQAMSLPHSLQAYLVEHIMAFCHRKDEVDIVLCQLLSKQGKGWIVLEPRQKKVKAVLFPTG